MSPKQKPKIKKRRKSSQIAKIYRVTFIYIFSVVYYYAGPRPLAMYVAIYALLALMFVARTHLVSQEKSWRQSSSHSSL